MTSGEAQGTKCAQVHGFGVRIKSVLSILEVESKQTEAGGNGSVGASGVFEMSPHSNPGVYGGTGEKKKKMKKWQKHLFDGFPRS